MALTQATREHAVRRKSSSKQGAAVLPWPNALATSGATFIVQEPFENASASFDGDPKTSTKAPT